MIGRSLYRALRVPGQRLEAISRFFSSSSLQLIARLSFLTCMGISTMNVDSYSKTGRRVCSFVFGDATVAGLHSRWFPGEIEAVARSMTN